MSAPFTDPIERWHQSWFVAPVEILGFRCRPLCLGSLVYLSGIDSPLLKFDGKPGFEIPLPEFVAALKVLESAEWPFSAVIDFTPDERALEIQRLASEAAATGAENPIAAAFNNVFLPWWLECHLAPELVQQQDSGGRSLTAPYPLALAVRLMRCGFSEERVWTMPLPTLRFYAAAIAEQEGAGAEFVTPELATAMDEMNSRPSFDDLTDEEQFERVKTDRGEAFAKQWLARKNMSDEEMHSHILALRGAEAADAAIAQRRAVRERRAVRGVSTSATRTPSPEGPANG